MANENVWLETLGLVVGPFKQHCIIPAEITCNWSLPRPEKFQCPIVMTLAPPGGSLGVQAPRVRCASHLSSDADQWWTFTRLSHHYYYHCIPVLYTHTCDRPPHLAPRASPDQPTWRSDKPHLEHLCTLYSDIGHLGDIQEKVCLVWRYLCIEQPCVLSRVDSAVATVCTLPSHPWIQ